MASEPLSAAAYDESIWATVRHDLRQAAGLRIIAVVLLLAWMAFQWGFGNDAILPSAVAWTMDAVDNGESWPNGFAAIAASTLVGFAFWAITQVIDAVLMLSGLRLLPRVADRISRFVRRKGWVTPYAEMKWSTRWLIAYASGASIVCLIDSFATGQPGLKQRKRMIAVTTLLSAGSVAIVVALVSTAVVVARRIPSTERGAEVFVRFAKNPLTWITIFLVVILVSKLRDRASRPTRRGVSGP